jgi:tetratricopeptide (TPR) repeat protein
LGRKQEAIASLILNTEMHPKSANACACLADALRKSGDQAAAVEWHRKALEIDPMLQSSIDALKTLSP